MRKVIAVAAALLVLTGCASDDEPASSSESSAELPSKTTESPEPTPEPDSPSKSPRGNFIKNVGEVGGSCPVGVDPCTKEQLWFSFTVDAIRPDLPCKAEYGPLPEPTNGHYIGVDVRAATTAEFPADAYLQINSDHFEVITPDGLTVSALGGNAYLCLPQSEWFTLDFLGPAQQYAGTVVLDSPVAHGTLVYKPSGSNLGWEWTF